jgi:CBS-domain-containing membrane protein
MAKLLFRLNGVIDDEADDVRTLLADADLSVYETHAGRWGLSVAAIWIRDENEYEVARAIINAYQQLRYEKIRAEPQETIGERIGNKPASALLTLIAVAAIIGLTIGPFLTVFK